MTPAPWTTGVVFNPKSPRPNVIIWSGTPAVAVARDVAAADAPLICAAPELASQLAAQKELVTLYSACAAKAERQRDALKEAVTALRRVAFHREHCPAFPPGCGDQPCTCGYDDAEELSYRAAIEACK